MNKNSRRPILAVVALWVVYSTANCTGQDGLVDVRSRRLTDRTWSIIFQIVLVVGFLPPSLVVSVSQDQFAFAKTRIAMLFGGVVLSSVVIPRTLLRRSRFLSWGLGFVLGGSVSFSSSNFLGGRFFSGGIGFSLGGSVPFSPGSVAK